MEQERERRRSHMEEPNIKEVAERIRLLREDCDFTMQEMADAVDGF